MGDGLKRASLSVVLSRGPWLVGDHWLTPDGLRSFYEAIQQGKSPSECAAVLGADALSDRRCDRALSLLKKASLVSFDRKDRRWRAD